MKREPLIIETPSVLSRVLAQTEREAKARQRQKRRTLVVTIVAGGKTCGKCTHKTDNDNLDDPSGDWCTMFQASLEKENRRLQVCKDAEQ